LFFARNNLLSTGDQVTFRKGQSGNPSGRPAKTPDLLAVENLARQHSPAAIKRLREWMDADNPKASVTACIAILNRAFGQPRQPVAMSGNVTVTTAQTIEDMHQRVRALRLATDNGKAVDAA
jgi:hypothetical protein